MFFQLTLITEFLLFFAICYHYNGCSEAPKLLRNLEGIGFFKKEYPLVIKISNRCRSVLRFAIIRQQNTSIPRSSGKTERSFQVEPDLEGLTNKQVELLFADPFHVKNRLKLQHHQFINTDNFFPPVPHVSTVQLNAYLWLLIKCSFYISVLTWVLSSRMNKITRK